MIDLSWSLTCCVAIIHALVFFVAVGYAQNYYFHLRKYMSVKGCDQWLTYSQVTTRTTLTRRFDWR